MRQTDIARRRFFRRVAGSTAAVLLARMVSAQELAALTDDAPETLAQAVATGDREVVAGFILRFPDRANGASLRDRAAAIRLMAHGRTAKEVRAAGSSAWGKAPETCAGCQRAGLVLLEHSKQSPAELQAFVDAVGEQWLESTLPELQNRMLQTRIEEGLRLIRTSRG